VSKRSLRVGLSFAISAVFLAFAVRGVDWAEAGRALQQAHYWAVAPSIGFVVWSLYVRAQRWRFFLRPVGRPHMRTLVAATNIGFMANMVLPLRIGEVVRPLLASRRERLPLSSVLATVVLERIFDMFTVLFLFGVAAAFVPVSEQLRAWGFRLTGLAVVIGGGVAFVRWQEERSLALVRGVLRVAPAAVRRPVEMFFEGFVRALEVLDSPVAFLRALAYSLFLWMVIAGSNASIFFTFDLPVPFFLAAMAVTAIIAIAVSVPSAPGYIGSFQLGCTLSLALFAVDQNRAIAYSIVLHLAQFVGIIAAGLYSLWTEGMSLHDVEAVSEERDVAA
jgi:hypothetical protein